MAQITQKQLQRRLHAHLTNHYMQLHNTLVSVTLAAGGLAAASLISSGNAREPERWLYWVMWAGVLLAIAVAYVGTATGVFMLPVGVPSALDLLLPLVIGVSQFIAFWVLLQKNNPLGSPGPAEVVRAWLFAMTGFGLACIISILRAKRMVQENDYEGKLKKVVSFYRSSLGCDALGASFMTVLCAAGGFLFSLDKHVSMPRTFGIVGFVVLAIVFGLVQHHFTGRGLKIRIADAGALLN